MLADDGMQSAHPPGEEAPTDRAAFERALLGLRYDQVDAADLSLLRSQSDMRALLVPTRAFQLQGRSCKRLHLCIVLQSH